MNKQSQEIQDNNGNELIELQNHGDQKDSQDQRPHSKSLLFAKIKQFWMQKIQVAKKLNTVEPHHEQQTNQFKRILNIGLEMQQYLGEETQFSRLYAQQIQNDFSQSRSSKQSKVFKRKAKLMLQRYLEKNEEAKAYLFFPVNWVKQQIPSYPHLIKDPICIKQIQTKLIFNQYDSFEAFLSQMNKIFYDMLVFTHENKQVHNIILKLRNNWEMIKFQVLKLKNFAIQPFFNPPQEFVPEMLDVDEEISILRERVSVDKNISEYLDYDSDYLTSNKSKNNSSVSNSEQKRKKSHDKKKSSNNKNKTKTKKVFQSCQSQSKIIDKQRILELKKNISKCISSEMSQKDFQKRRFLKYLNKKRGQNPKYIGSQNEINLQLLDYQEFIELEETTKKYLNNC